MKKILGLSLALALAGLTNTAFAAEGGAGFIRAEVGQSDGDLEVEGLGSDSDDDTSYSIRGGYWFNSNFAIEGFYSNLYDKSNEDYSLEVRSFGVGVVGKKNFGADGNGFFIGGRAGVERVEGDLEIPFFGIDGSESSNEIYYGVGVGYDFSDSFGLSLNYDFHGADSESAEIDAETLSLGAEIRF